MNTTTQLYKEAKSINEKSKKKKQNPVEPPLQRIWVDDITEKQKAWCDDMCLCRYLRARDWDLDKAEIMIRCTFAFREDYKVDEITAADIDAQAKQGKMYFNNEFTNSGMPIIYMKIARDQGNDRVTNLKYLVWMLEQVIKSMDVSRGVEKMAWVTDFKGMGLRMSGMANMQISLDCLHVLLDHYPERLGVAYALNPPKVFSVFWKVLKPFMNEVTLSKIKFVSGPKQYPQLLEHIPKQILEKIYGGDKDFEYDHRKWRAQQGLDATSGPEPTPPVPFPAVGDESDEGFVDGEDDVSNSSGGAGSDSEENGKGKEPKKSGKKEKSPKGSKAAVVSEE